MIGLLVTLAINADTFHILEKLNKDAALRSSINQVATKIVAENKEPSLDKINSYLDNITMPLGWSTREQFKKQVNPRDPAKSKLGD